MYNMFVLLTEGESDRLGVMRGEKMIVSYANERKEELPSNVESKVPLANTSQ
jgi:hypothetical protein